MSNRYKLYFFLKKDYFHVGVVTTELKFDWYFLLIEIFIITLFKKYDKGQHFQNLLPAGIS